MLKRIDGNTQIMVEKNQGPSISEGLGQSAPTLPRYVYHQLQRQCEEWVALVVAGVPLMDLIRILECEGWRD